MHEIAAGLGVTYEALTGDLTGVNYSSGRMGWLEFGRNIDTWRWDMVEPQMLDPVEAGRRRPSRSSTGSSEPFSIHWTPPARTMIDVEMENQASKDAIRNGLSSRSEEVRKRGLDPIALDDENAADNDRADALGLVYDSDPRAVSGKGVSQKPDTAVTTKTGKGTRAEARDLLNGRGRTDPGKTEPWPSRMLAKGAADVRALMQGTQSLVMNGQIMLYGVIDSTLDPSARCRSSAPSTSWRRWPRSPTRDKVVVRLNSPGGSVIEGWRSTTP